LSRAGSQTGRARRGGGTRSPPRAATPRGDRTNRGSRSRIRVLGRPALSFDHDPSDRIALQLVSYAWHYVTATPKRGPTGRDSRDPLETLGRRKPSRSGGLASRPKHMHRRGLARWLWLMNTPSIRRPVGVRRCGCVRGAERLVPAATKQRQHRSVEPDLCQIRVTSPDLGPSRNRSFLTATTTVRLVSCSVWSPPSLSPCRACRRCDSRRSRSATRDARPGNAVPRCAEAAESEGRRARRAPPSRRAPRDDHDATRARVSAHRNAAKTTSGRV
jgi:hypothetical protein